MIEVETIIAACAAVGVVIPLIVTLSAFLLSRIYFGGYVRRIHPQVWNDLVLQGARLNVVSLRLSFDATPELATFRASDDDLGDPELAKRRGIANRTERLCFSSFLGGVGWIVISAAIIVWLRSSAHS